MRKILVAIDGSDSALRALEFARREAALVPGTELHILTVLEPVRVFGEIEVYVDEARIREVAGQQARAGLDLAMARLSDSGLPVQSEVVEGDPAELITERAAQLGCHSIVTGTRGLGRIGALLMGSVAQKVVQLARMPVTLVK